MKNFTEFKAKIESDAAFRAKFTGLTDEKQILDVAKAEGYDLTLLSDEELDQVAGGYQDSIIGNLVGKFVIGITKGIREKFSIFIKENKSKIKEALSKTTNDPNNPDIKEAIA